MSVPITGNLTETQRFPAPLSGRGARQAAQSGSQLRISASQKPLEREKRNAQRRRPFFRKLRPPGCLRLPHLSQELLDGREKNCIGVLTSYGTTARSSCGRQATRLSSAQCTNRFKRLGQKKIGHAGTLDPMAQGVLLVLLGHATKISGYLMAGASKPIRHCPARADH